MEKPLPASNPSRRNWNLSLWTLMPLEGIAAIVALLRIPSEEGAARLLGFSAQRLLVAGGAAALVGLLAVFAWAEWRQPAWRQRLGSRAARWLASPGRRFRLVETLWLLLLGLGGFIYLSSSPITHDLTILHTLMDRMGLVLIWFELILAQAGLLLWVNTPAAERRQVFWLPTRRAAVLVLVLGLAYFIYQLTAASLGLVYNPEKAYWNLLAEAFLKGQMYLVNPPSYHDLTLFNGQWFVPNPPLPALVMLPFVGLFGAQNVETIFFSIVCSAINVLLVYLVLEKAAERGLIPAGKSARAWLTILFAVGTVQWWLAILGSMWFVSQILTVTFAALAALLVLRQASPWWVGLSLGLAMASRPNVFTLWPFLAGMALYLGYQEPGGGVQWKRFIAWAARSAVPVCLAVGGLLVYNYVRFHNFFDFGYVTINGAPQILTDVTSYGMFNLHFIPINFKVMFLNLPGLSLLNSGCLYYNPTKEGTAILAGTPALIYLFRRFKWNAWTAGAWISVLLSVGALLMYSNTGAEQAGYRYLADFIVPVILLLGFGIGSRPSWLFKGLAILSIILNAANILAWFGRWPCGN